MSSLPNRSLTDAVKRSAAFLLVSLAALSRPAGAGPAERLWQFLSTHPESGVFGYPGEVALRKYVFREFRRLGLKEVHGLPFETGTPFQHYARLQVAGEVNTQDPKSETSNPTSQIRHPKSEIPLQCFWPNQVRTCSTPREGIKGKLLYAGDGQYRRFDGQEVRGRIVLLDLDCGDRWLNAFELGASAVVFLPKGPVPRQELEKKLLSLPLNAPRFLAPERSVGRLKELAATEAEVTLAAWQEWRQVTGYDVLGKIPGTDPELGKEHLVISAHYDRISAVPTLAPGAENLVSLAALLEVAEELAQHPPKRTVVLLATSAHYLGMAGMGAFVRAYALAARDVVLQADLDPDGKRSARLKGLMNRYFSGYADEKQQPLTFLMSLDLSAGGTRTGIFHFGAYEENRDLYRERRYVLVGQRVARQTEALEKTSGLAAATHFADGINPQKGRSPESFFSELPAFESEVASLVFPGLAWATCSDDRDFVNTPFDTLDRLLARTPCVRERTGSVRERTPCVRRDSADAQIGYLRRLMPLIANDERFPVRTVEDGRLKEPVFGQSVWWDKGETFFPSTPVPFPVAAATIQRGWLGGFMRSYPKPLFGVHMEQTVVGDAEGKWSLENFLWPYGARAESQGVDPLLLVPGDLSNVRHFAERLERARDPLSAYLKQQLPPEAAARLREYVAASEDEKMSVERSLMDAVNLALLDRKLYAADRFAGVALLDELRLRAERRPAGVELSRLNRLLLHAAYPAAIPAPPQSGAIALAPDKGEEGDRKSSFLNVDVGAKGGRLLTQVLFHCTGMDFVNLFDPRQLTALRNVSVLDAKTATEPMEFGWSLPLATRYDSSYVEPCAVVFADPPSRISALMGGGLIGHRLVLIHSTPKEPFGVGLPATTARVPLAMKQVAHDLYQLDEYRLGILKRHGIESEYLHELHVETKRLLDESGQSVNRRLWSRAVPAASRAWALESTVYPATLATSNDVVKGVLLYLLLTLPFAYFIERLLFGFADIRKQIAATVGVFGVVLVILAAVHPAFSITFTPFIIFLAFLILTLAAIVSSIIVRKFQVELRQLRGGMRGVREADVNRVGALTAAINLGIANMRRRPIRTWLTCSTIVLLTFTVLSFTSLRGFMKYNQFPLPWQAPFEGLMLRNLSWGSLEEGEYRGFMDSLSDRFYVAPRYWHMPPRPEEPTVTEVSITTPGRAAPQILALDTVVGLGVNEPRCTAVGRTLTAGRWFRAGEQACLVPDTVAQAAGITRGNMRQSQVTFYGTPLTVCGIFSSKKMDQIKGLGEEPITPVNFLMYRPAYRSEDEELHPDALAMEEYIHWPSSTTLLIPAEVSAAKGGTLREILAAPKRNLDLEAELAPLLRKWSLILYVGQGGQAKLYSSLASSSFSGFKDLFIPVLIAAIIVLNTMLGSVYERVREIGVYNSVGLSPVHIASLFLAEAAVYATIGAILGYLLGQVAAKVLTVTGWLPGLTLNYSSGSAATTILFVVAVVMLSAIYPARQATRMAVPDLETSWQLGEPEGDHWAFRLPFQVSEEQALDMAGFMFEFFAMHREQAVGNFFAQGIVLSVEAQEPAPAPAPPASAPQSSVRHARKVGPRLDFTAWLAPYDFGVSHRVAMWTEEVAPGTLGWRLDLTRVSGDVTSWRRATQTFLKRVRKQLLLWRAVNPADRGTYRETALAQLGQRAGEGD
ncbi:MAG: hypothetical protein COZ06_13615 [Armatimonadetes bacterium CG_4_10_14_3_um_filter_66_18]|nr:FtsX-like permease family protein [Armatimonadota bacterium]PIY49612.1 MAG: hypothetical protein COZ06_13615 [Armatimonadetes bacterium CG_4_10_14_3_um_filter_66_18]